MARYFSNAGEPGDSSSLSQFCVSTRLSSLPGKRLSSPLRQDLSDSHPAQDRRISVSKISCAFAINAVLTAAICAGSAGAASQTGFGKLGDALQIAIPAAAAYDISLREEHPDEHLGKLATGWLAAVGTTHILKEAFSTTDAGTRPRDRERGKRGGKNMPSGHTTSACQPAFYHLTRYQDFKSAAMVAGCVATGLSRIHEKAHDEKAVAGAFIVSGISLITGPLVDSWIEQNTGLDIQFAPATGYDFMFPALDPDIPADSYAGGITPEGTLGLKIEINF